MSIGAIIGITIGAVVLGLAVAFVIWLIATYNSMIKLRNNVDEGFSTMDVYLKKRYDLIPNLVEVVKGYSKHEAETLEKVVEARNVAMASKDVAEQLKNENALSSALRSLFAVAESYPDLKANANYLDLQNSLNNIEEEIASSRKYYNGVVKLYNIKREVFPSNMLAKMFHFEPRPLYEIEDTAQRKNVSVKF